MEQVPGCLIDSNQMNVNGNDRHIIAWITGQLYAMKFVTEQKTEEFRGGNWVWKQSTIYLNVSLTQYALWYFSIVSKIPPVKQHMDCNVSLEPLTLPSCAHNPGFAHNVHWPRIGHLAEGNDPWPNGQCQFLTFQCQCLNFRLKEFDGRFPIGQCRALLWTGLVEDSHTKYSSHAELSDALLEMVKI